MEDILKELIKTSPGYACILAVIWFGMKWHERIATHWVDSFKEVGQKCHEAHEKVSHMFHEQSCRGQEVLTKVSSVMAETNVHMERCANAHEEQVRMIRERN